MNANTLKAITRHGETLLAAFPNAIERDPVALCKKLRRIEWQARHAMELYCNGVTNEKAADDAAEKAIARVKTLLGLDDGGAHMAGLFVNRDPRGCALKLESRDTSSWFADWQDKQYKLGKAGHPIPTDMGGYGILAPDLTEGNR